ncbi:Hypothetical predicted protein [Mytilus galloprovincialis]|uniref:C1q domain-containing protein n=1 Tax=Mytilus galloprovincialis TaxID=29158 RepID=A0A8B6FYX6_MYTGA|nr:Hypothetical predicted protein [Mytilus galloprovincialis]
MYFVVIFLVSLGGIYSEECNSPSIIQQMKTEVDFLSKRLTALQGKLSSCEAEPSTSAYTAFTATLSSNDVTLSKGEIVKYSRVLTNIGNCYDSATGVFTVKTSGIYSVSVSMMTPPDMSSHLILTKNGQNLVWLYTGGPYHMASQTVHVALKGGDKLSVQQNSGTQLHAYYNLFTAALIKPGTFKNN